MATEFTWFAKITRIYERIPDVQDRARFAMAVIDFGTEGKEPNLEYPLDSLFESVRDDIVNSVNARTNNKGGRPRKHAVAQDDEPAVSECSDEQKTEGSEEPKQGVLECVEQSENPPLYSPMPMPSPNPRGNEKKAAKPPFDAIVSYLNAKAGTSFKSSSKATQSLISGRWRDGYTLDDFKAVIDAKCAEWLTNPKMRQYLRPKTLFAASNFECYLQQPKAVSSYDKYN